MQCTNRSLALSIDKTRSLILRMMNHMQPRSGTINSNIEKRRQRSVHRSVYAAARARHRFVMYRKISYMIKLDDTDTLQKDITKDQKQPPETGRAVDFMVTSIKLVIMIYSSRCMYVVFLICLDRQCRKCTIDMISLLPRCGVNTTYRPGLRDRARHWLG